jgi:hypothetical protein
MSASPQRFDVDPAEQLLVEDLADELCWAMAGDCTHRLPVSGAWVMDSLPRSVEIEDELAQTHDEDGLVAPDVSEASRPADADAMTRIPNCQRTSHGGPQS